MCSSGGWPLSMYEGDGGVAVAEPVPVVDDELQEQGCSASLPGASGDQVHHTAPWSQLDSISAGLQLHWAVLWQGLQAQAAQCSS